MKKKNIYGLFMIMLFLLFPIHILALDLPETYSKSALIYDATSEKVMFERHASDEKNVASLTKIMTTILAIEKIEDLNAKVTYTEEIKNSFPWDSSTAGLKVGDSVTYMDLLYASMLPSGADATHTLAVNLSGSVDDFVREMNRKAKSLGMESTHYVNVTGYDAEGHYSTAKDVRTLLSYALKNELFQTIWEAKSYKLTNGLEVSSTISNYNKSMNLDVSEIKGSKTGFTDGAGLCIAATFEANGHDMIVITLGADYVYNDYYNLRDALKLINFMQDNYEDRSIVKQVKVLQSIPVELSKIDKYNIYTNKDVKLYLPSDYDKEKISISFVGKESLNYKDKKGSEIGKVQYKYNDVLMLEEPVILEEDMHLSLSKVIKKYILVIIAVIVLLFLFYKNVQKKKRRRVRRSY